MRYDVALGDRSAQIEVRPARDGGYLVRVDGGPERHIQADAVGRAEWLVREAGRSTRVALARRADSLYAQRGGVGEAGHALDPRRAGVALDGAAAEGAVSTQMPGAVVRVLVAAGDAVRKGQALVVVEAMKMENEFKAPADGTVEAVHVAAGQTVEAGTLLVSVKVG